jgi:hypothetical protein
MGIQAPRVARARNSPKMACPVWVSPAWVRKHGEKRFHGLALLRSICIMRLPLPLPARRQALDFAALNL